MMTRKMIFSGVMVIFTTIFTCPSSGQVTWEKELSNPVLVPDQPWESYQVWGPAVIKLDRKYVMGYCSSDAIGMAVSPDGIHWTKHESNPVFTPGPPGSWDSVAVSDPVVIFDGTTFYMWYHGKSSGGIQIGLATSTDGVHWVRCPDNPVLQKGPAGGWDGSYVTHPNVLYEPNTTLPFKMWFTGRQSGYWRWQVGAAYSMDGVVWVKWEENPVLPDRDTCWDSYFCARSSTIRRPHYPFEMLYSGAQSTYYDRIGYAVSCDGIHWKRFDEPVLFPTQSWEGHSVDDPSFMFDEGVYKVWYAGNVRRGIGYAESHCGN